MDTLRGFLEEHGYRTQPMLWKLEKSEDPEVLKFVKHWKRENEGADETFAFSSQRGKETEERIIFLINLYFAQNGFSTVFQRRNPGTFFSFLKKGKERKTVAVTFEANLTLVTVTPI